MVNPHSLMLISLSFIDFQFAANTTIYKIEFDNVPMLVMVKIIVG